MKNEVYAKKLVVFTNPFSIPDKYLYGSRGIDVNEDSVRDFDIYCHIEDLNKFGFTVFDLKTKFTDPSSYLGSLPKYGRVFLKRSIPTVYTDFSCDLLVFSDKRDVEIMRKTVKLLRGSKALLSDKQTRIEQFNLALQHYGFKPNINTAFDTQANLTFQVILKRIEIPERGIPIHFDTNTSKPLFPAKKKESTWKRILTNLKNTFTKK